MYPFSVFQNLSGIKWTTARIEWWYYSIYTPWFGVSINIHPNYFKQVFK